MKYKMADNNEVELVLNFKLLYALKTKRPDLYEEINKIIMNGAKDIFEFLKVIYVAYVCANFNQKELNYPTFNSFFENCDLDIKKVAFTANALMSQKKIKNS